MSDHQSLVANSGELLIWNTLKQNPNDKSCTLSYRFFIEQKLTHDEINEAIYRLLMTHNELSYRFYENEGILYKRYYKPSPNPLVQIEHSFGGLKKLFKYHLECLYTFQWQEGGNGFYLFVHLSHLIIDGSGFERLVNALESAFLKKAEQNIEFRRSEFNPPQDHEYWRNYLSNKSLHQVIPFLKHFKQTELVTCQHMINAQMLPKLLQFQKDKGVTLFQLMSCALAITLHHYLKDEETETSLSLAYYVNLKKDPNTLGCNINLLPLFITCDDQLSFAEVLQSIINTRQTHRGIQHTSLYDILSYFNHPIHPDQPLLNVVINESPGLLPYIKPGFIKEVSAIENHSAVKTLTLVYTINEEGLMIRLESKSDMQAVNLLAQLAQNIEKTLDYIISEYEQKISSLVFRQKMIPVCKGEQTLPDRVALGDKFIQKIRANPNKIAILDGNSTLTYKQVYCTLNALYSRLSVMSEQELAHGAGIFLSRSSLLPVAMLCTLVANIPFIPIVDTLPFQARRSLIEEVQLKILFIDNKTELLLSDQEKEAVQLINVDSLSIGDEPINNPILTPLIQGNVAYILFTSGSTGKPKGVMITQDNLNHFFTSMATKPGFTQHDTMLALTPVSFDIAINELLLPLYCGGSLLIAADQVKNSKQLGQLINDDTVSIVQATPSTLQLLRQSEWVSTRKTSLCIWVGGEALTETLVDFFSHQKISLFNMYGPTESTIWVSATPIESSKLLSIGSPLNNTSFYVLDNIGLAMPLGIPGELVIEGELVAKGYMNHPSTAFKKSDTGLMRYYTGDKVVALAPDTLIYLKRNDDQVKLRGYRIELEEINGHIRTLVPGFIGLCLVLPDPEPHLCVYYTKPEHLNIQQLTQKLKLLMPEYKVPQRYSLLETLPLTQNGKIDRKHLTSRLYQEQLNTQPQSIQQLKTGNANIEQTIVEIIARNFGITITDFKRSLLDYGFNSLSFNQLSVVLEKELLLTINPHQFYHLNSVKKIVDFYFSNSIPPSTNEMFLSDNEITHNMPIAIIGYDALLPGSKDPEQFWQALLDQEHLITSNTRCWLNCEEQAGYIDDIASFDRKFFNLLPVEAMHMDFRQRLLMQCAFRTLEHAGIPAIALEEKQVACFISATGMDSLLATNKHQIPAHPYTLSGNALSMLANRLSYYFNWHGPSVTVDSACSGSLAALARAVECLQLGKSPICFVGSANLITDDEITKSLKAGGFLSPNHCSASFLSQADGYVRGEGVLGFLLKPLSMAKKDGDVIHAVINNVVENHGGRAASLTAPSKQAQTDLLKAAYPKNLASRLSYIETHGTGTKLGDPIEIDALKAFEHDLLGDNQHPAIYLGSLKQNIGHLEASAGFASIMKIVLAMKYNQLPPNCYSQTLNPLINLDDSKFKLIDKVHPWGINQSVTAGVSSFGFGGSNAHAVLSSLKGPGLDTTEEQLELPVILSAKTMTALRARIENLRRDLSNESRFKDIAYHLAMGREHFVCRTALIASNKQQLEIKLTQLLQADNLLLPIDNNSPYSAPLTDFLAGKPVEWVKLFAAHSCKRVALIPYSFDKNTCLHPAFQQQPIENNNLFTDISLSQTNDGQQQITIKGSHIFLAHHHVFHRKVLPGVAYIELLLMRLSAQKGNFAAICIENMRWVQPALSNDDDVTLNLTLNTTGSKTTFQFLNQKKQLHSTGEYLHDVHLHTHVMSWLDEAKLLFRQDGLPQLTSAQLYEKFSTLGINYGPYFKGIESVALHTNMALTTITIEQPGSIVGLLDAAFQTGMAINLDEVNPGLMPFSLGKLTIFDVERLRTIRKSVVYTLKNSPYRTSFIICDEHSIPLVAITDLGVKPSQLKIAGVESLASSS